MASAPLIEKNSLPFLFNEDIYSIAEKTTIQPLVEKEKNIESAKPTSSIEIKKETAVESVAAAPIIEIKTETVVAPKKNYAVILNNAQEHASEKEFLTKILGAIKLDFNQVDLLYSDTIENNFITTPQYKTTISFGLDPMKYQHTYYNITKANNGVLLFSHSLSDLAKDVQKKKALWAALQKLL